MLVSFTDPDFDPGPTFEPADSTPFALSLVAFDSLDLIGLFPAILLEEVFFAPPASGFFSTLLFTVPVSPPVISFPSPQSFLVSASVDVSTKVAPSGLATSSELRRRFGVAGVT